MNCRHSGCARRVSGYSAFCAKHAQRKRRHGHVDQCGITTEHLRPHVDLVRSYVARHGGEESWAKLEAALNVVAKDAAGVVAESTSGRPFHFAHAAAAAELVRVVQTADPRAIIETVAAMTILQQREPGLFQCDEAFWVQTARRFRGLSPATKQRHYSRAAERVKTHSRDPRLDVAVRLGKLLCSTLGVIGTRISDGENAEHNRRATALQDAYATLRPAAAA